MAVLLGVLIGLYGLALMAAPYTVWSVTASLALRNPSRAEPSERHLRYWRVSGSILTTVGVGVGAVVVGRDGLRVVALVAAAMGVLTLALLVRAWRTPGVDESELPPDEPSDVVYGWWSLVFVAWLVIVVVAVVSLLGVPTRDELSRAWLDEGTERWGPALTADLPVLDEVPEDQLAVPQGTYLVLDPADPATAQLYAVAAELGDGTAERLGAADLVLVAGPGMTCRVTGAVVHEVEPAEDAPPGPGTTVEVALLTDEATSVEECIEDEVVPSAPFDAVLVDLGTPPERVSLVPHPDAPACVIHRLVAVPGLELDDATLCELEAWDEERPDRRSTMYVSPPPQETS